MDLDLETIRSVAEKLAEEQRRIKIELEPEIDGKYATTIMDLIEPRPTVRRSDASILATHHSTSALFEDREEAEKALNGFIDELQKLPRLTREFLGWLIDNSDQALGFADTGLSINADHVAARRRDVDGLSADVRLLRAWGFLDYDQDESHESGQFTVYFPGANGASLDEGLVSFILEEKLSATTLFSTMNFTPFGPTPDPNAPSTVSKLKPKVKRLKKNKNKK
jgi:hypothetical protein